VSFDNTIFNLSGWQLMFIVEGFPAVLLGFVVFYFLIDSPRKATWLTPGERQWLTEELDREAKAARTEGRHDFKFAFRSPTVWGFVVVYFCYACGAYGLALFLPQILKQLDFTTIQTGFVGALPYVAGLVVMILNGRHSDRTGERRWHFSIPLLVASGSLLAAGLNIGSPWVALSFLTLTGAGLYAALGTFWSRPMALLAGTAAAAGIALINSLGNVGGFVGPYIVGFLRSSTDSYSAGLIALSTILAIGGLVSIGLKDRPARATLD